MTKIKCKYLERIITYQKGTEIWYCRRYGDRINKITTPSICARCKDRESDDDQRYIDMQWGV